jgi:mevalonate kinase
METITASSPGKIILFGEYGVNREQPAISTAVSLRVLCRVRVRKDLGYSLRFMDKHEKGDRARLASFKGEVDALRKAKELDKIRERARDFFAPARYVLAHVIERFGCPGVDVEWRSPLPIGSGMGSGATASTSMIRAVVEAAGRAPAPEEIAHLSWQGDVIAHGGIASSLDSSTCAFGGLIYFTVSDGAKPLSCPGAPRLVIGDSKVRTDTATLNTKVRKWLERHPSRTHLFKDMGYLVRQAIPAFREGDYATLGRLMNLHQLLQEKIGTSCPELDRLVEAALDAGALGAKISGSGGGGIMIALVPPSTERAVANAIAEAGGGSILIETCDQGTRLEPAEAWAENNERKEIE